MSCPGPWNVDLPPRFVSTTSTAASFGTCSSAVSSARRPSVTTGGCSSSRIVSGIAPCETAPARERWRSHASRYGTRPSCCRYPPLAALSLPRLEPLAQLLEETAGVRAVDEAMVVCERDVHQRPDRDHVVAELVLDHPWPLDERVGAEDAGLRLADDRRAVEGAVAAGIRDRERAALHVVRQQLLVARPLRDVRDRTRHPEQVQPFGVLHDGDDEALAVRK